MLYEVRLPVSSLIKDSACLVTEMEFPGRPAKGDQIELTDEYNGLVQLIFWRRKGQQPMILLAGIAFETSEFKEKFLEDVSREGWKVLFR